MAGKQETNERPKFKISLAEFLRKGLTARDYTTYKPQDLVSDSATNSNREPEIELTPKQKARKRYEERNKEIRREKARVRMAKATDYEANRVKQKDYEEQYRKTHREERRYGEDRRRAIRYIENWGPRAFTNYRQRRNGHLQRPEDYINQD
ncbi:hypothetical protein F5878DRAFT_645644 [Lentinula raphanica]|uniref:Uncharacterized protein n=1 Tax=Lentinula raphanica TaxID=153919 RepID=A0AA38P031_9AGAR|nr:hypothetical protein C8R42DRAFT_729420 [Lentinula raphanica]KAJ3717360.1 hypothetical protein C8R42DRAFT_724263 [Lentinula raphanica]KAJ3833812.1 hypothetical protein F5878DRAFT_645644 [Lentinula raphanica]